MFKECFGEHPYGRPVIGLTEHLKNPQTSKMREFFNTYYVANNMTLIMVGDFNTEEIKPLIEEKFSVWERRELPQRPEFELPAFDKEIIKEVKLTPMKMGSMIYKGVDNKHEDNLSLEVLMYLFSNGATGILDKSMLNNELMLAMMLPMSLEEHGRIIFLYVPKLVGQSHEKAEAIIFNAIDKIKDGDFSEDLLEAAKTSILKERVQTLEGIDNLSYVLMGLESIGKDVKIEKANDAFMMYSSKNPYNNIFNLKITYNHGSIDNPELGRANELWSLLGTESKTYEEIELELQKMGVYMYVNVGNGSSSLTISGFEENLDEILAICEDKIFNPKFDASKLNILIDSDKMNKKTDKTSPDTWNNALYQYILFGDNSYYLNKMDIEKWAKRDGDEILNDFKEIFNYGGEITFSGNLDTKDVIASLNSHNIIKNDAIKAEKKINIPQEQNENVIYFAHNKKFRQSNITMYVQGEKLNEQERALSSVFNKYFGTDMYSIVFQEIRELRSLGYTAYSYYSSDHKNRYPGYQYAYVGTQSDKTNEAVDAMRALIVDMPEKMEKFDTSKDALIMSRAADYISPRNIPSTVSYWIENGYDHDPRIEITNYIKETDYEDIYKFYQEKVQNRPIVIMIAGNKKKVDMKALEKYGELRMVKFDEIYK